jgi:prepilin-type processing-associated H-X9-DG protein
MKTTHALAVQNSRADGFTQTDLLAIMITAGMLGALLLPALAATKPDSQAFRCLENQRQLVRAWQMYAQDNNGKLAPNGNEATQASSSPHDPVYQGADLQWCPGRVDPSAPAGWPTNAAFLQAGCIYPYVKTVTVYRCPADHSTALVYGTQLPRCRSISMNGWMNPIEIWDTSANGRVFRKEGDLGLMGPANIWLLMDENPYSINDAMMAEFPPAGPTAAANLNWVDYPATYHNGGSGMSFCDGHAEIRKWTDPVVLNMRIEGPVSLPATAGNGDLAWLQAHATRGE